MRNLRYLQKKYLGQTLIETLVTVLLISVGTIALIRFQNYLAYDNSLAQQKTEATILAANRLEILRDYHVLNTTTGYTAYQDIVSGSDTAAGASTTYTITWTVTPFTNPTYKTLNVLVSWTDRRGASQSVRLVSNIAGIDPSGSASVM